MCVAMAVSRLLFLVFLAQFCAGDDADTLKRVLYSVNAIMAKSGLEELPLESSSGVLYRVLSYQINNHRLGKLTTFVGRREFDQHFTNKTEGEAIITDFDVRVGLEEIYTTLDYRYQILGLSFGGGSLKIRPHGNTLRLIGSVKTTSNSCRTVLTSATVLELSDYEVFLTPSNIISSAMQRLFDWYVDLFKEASWLMQVNMDLGNLVAQVKYQQQFSDVVCAAWNK